VTTQRVPLTLLGERRTRVLDAAARRAIDVVVVTRPEHVRYLSGVDAYALLICPLRTTLVAAKGLARSDELERQGIGLVEYAAYDPERRIDPVMAAAAATDAEIVTWQPRRLGCDLGGVCGPIGSLHRGEVIDLDATFASIRRPKDAWEIDQLRRRVKILEGGLTAARAVARSGATEIDVLAATARDISGALGGPVRLDHSIGAGPRSAERNPQASPAELVEGDLLLLDLYPPLDGYFADLCRTWSIGRPTVEGERLHRAVIDALRAAEDVLGPDVPVAEVDNAVRTSLRRAGDLDLSMAHHSGHGIGIFAWDEPWIGRGSSGTLVAGDVIAIEPGAYLSGMGGVRVEGNYLVTENGYQRLDSFSEALAP
jgi:Xaa-Pro aminopeptidase